MDNGDVFDEDAMVFVEVPKVMASKCSSEVGDDAVRETESVDDVFEELDCFLYSSRDERFILDPLGELVDGDVYIPKTTLRWLERPNHIQSLASEGPGSWDGLQLLCRHVYLLGKNIGILHNVERGLLHRRWLWASKNQLEKLCRPVFSMSRGCRRSQSEF